MADQIESLERSVARYKKMFLESCEERSLLVERNNELELNLIATERNNNQLRQSILNSKGRK